MDLNNKIVFPQGASEILKKDLAREEEEKKREKERLSDPMLPFASLFCSKRVREGEDVGEVVTLSDFPGGDVIVRP
ncbi:hypothetical protein IT399_03490 [Candidatus Nomurabacteria bacterium]|nr:hypothetical protein [Candidatus Nomurabacteria bacterium]